MSDKVYDAIIIGGGHHGTIIAPYLAKAGMKVGVFERQDHLGGGAHTEEGPAPGLKQDFCAHCTRFYAHPAYHDFNLYDEGLHYVAPDTGAGAVFDDGSSFVGYPAWVLTDPKTGKVQYSEENVKKTYNQIAQFSKTDAETYLDLTDKAKNKWGPAFSRLTYSMPVPWGQRGVLEELFDDPESGLEPVMQFMTVKQLARYFFKSPELRILFIRGAISSYNIQVDDVPGIGGLFPILRVVLSWSPPSIAIGGTQVLTDALVSAGKKLGAEYFVNAEVDKVIVKNGEAKGIILKNGDKIEAKRLVVADAGFPEVMFHLLDGEYVTDETRRRMDATIYDRAQIFWGLVATHELPKYKAAESNHDANRIYRCYWAPKDLRYFEDKYWHERCLMGLSSERAIIAVNDTIWDPSRAPEGKHSMYIEELVCPLHLFSRKEWRSLLDEFEKSLFQQWQRYAPNMTADNIMATRLYGPPDLFEYNPDNIEGSICRQAQIASQNEFFRGLPEVADFRSPVKNLYLCGMDLPGGMGIARSSSYRAYRVIAEDHGLPRVWE